MTETKGCPKCNYTGFHIIDLDDTRVVQCICSYAKTLKAYLGPEIASAENIRQSVLYQLDGKGKPPKVDRTKDSLFIKSYWSDLLPHLKWTLAGKGPMFRFRIVTDEKLKSVYVGNESYKYRAKDVRDEIETFNSIGDLIGPDIDLVILRLGFLGYKNVAMPGVLKEALMLRESATKPTWLVETPDKPFTYGYFSYNEDVAEYIGKLFDVVTIKGDKPVYEALSSDLPQPDDSGVVGIPSAPVKPAIEFRPPPPPIQYNVDVVLDEGHHKYKKNGKKVKGGGPA